MVASSTPPPLSLLFLFVGFLKTIFPPSDDGGSSLPLAAGAGSTVGTDGLAFFPCFAASGEGGGGLEERERKRERKRERESVCLIYER